MIEPAALLVKSADVFVVVGTSLVVYPAAGLIHCAGSRTPKFIVDKRVPFTAEICNLTKIEKTATEGIRDLVEILEIHL